MTVLNHTKNSKRNSQLRGFTLVEMLTVMGIMAILGVLLVPALQGLQKGGNFTAATYNISDLMNLARTYAVANDTYVYVGFEEVKLSVVSGVTPQTVGFGRVAICIMASNDGTNSTGTSGSNLSVVRPVQLFDFLHVNLTAVPWNNPTTGNMSRPDGVAPSLLAAFTGTTINFPLGSSAGSAKYSFANVICYNPQGGVVNNSTAATTAGVPIQWAELDLQPFVGNATTAPTAPKSGTGVGSINQMDVSALVIEGATGSTTVYRP